MIGGGCGLREEPRLGICPEVTGHFLGRGGSSGDPVPKQTGMYLGSEFSWAVFLSRSGFPEKNTTPPPNSQVGE